MTKPHAADLEHAHAAIADHFGAHPSESHAEMLQGMSRAERRGLVSPAVRRAAHRRGLNGDGVVELLIDAVEDWLWPDTAEKRAARLAAGEDAERQRLVDAVLADPVATAMVLAAVTP